MADGFTYDVFLSHNSADKARVRRLAERLRDAGLRVWFDEWVIQPGDDIYLAIERGLEATRVQVLCLSAAALGSEWVTLERNTVLFRDPTNKDRRFVPLLLADCQLPDTLRRYKRVDYRVETEPAFKELLAACRADGEATLSVRKPDPTGVDPLQEAFLPAAVRRPGAGSPASLLNARYEVVPFFDAPRRRELEVLQQWCESPEPVSARLFVGPGGAGKTRLLLHWVRGLRERGWRAGFLREGVSAATLGALVACSEPTLLVVDYAEARGDLLDVLRHVAGQRPNGAGPLRLALLARQVADWWQMLRQHQGPEVESLLGQFEPLQLDEVPLDEELRQQAFQRACEKFAAERGQTCPSVSLDLSDERFGRMLYLHMAALATVEGLPTSADTLFEATLEHEARFWRKRYAEPHSHDLLVAAEFIAAARRTVAAATLLGGLPDREAVVETMRRAQVSLPDSFPRFLHWLYPGRGQAGRQDAYVAALEPDLLGETLVAGVLLDPETPRDYLEAVLTDASPAALENALRTLGHLGERRAEAHEWIRRALAADLSVRAPAAFAAAMSLCETTAASPLGMVLAEVLERSGTPELAAEFEPLVPKETVSLREVAVWSTSRLLAALPADARDDDTRQKRARLLNNLGNRLSAVGRWEEALEATREAVDLYRELARVRPDAFRPDLAMSLNNLGAMLSGLGHREEALEATREAVDLRRDLARVRPDAFRPDLAASLNNLGNRLSALGRREEALAATREAVDLRRELAHVRPDAFRPDLAASLSNLGSDLSDLGRREEALEATREAVDLRRELARVRPDAFRPDLAMSLNNLGNRLRDLGRREEALEATREAVEIRRELASAYPAVFLPKLAQSLENLGRRLSELGWEEEAREATRAAVEIWARLEGRGE